MSTQNPAVSLKVLAENKADGVTKETTFRVDPDLVEFEEGFNLRTDDDLLAAHQDRLYEAMKNGASIPPLDVRVENGKIICVEGHSRTMAARRLKLEVPTFTLGARQFRGNEQERVLHMLGTGSGQKPLSPLEQGIGYLRLVKYGMTNGQIAAKLGISVVTVANGLTLAEAPLEVQELVRSGAVSSTTAREAVKQGAEGVKALAKKAAEQQADPAKTPTGKTSKKKKVTANKLAGTAADKNSKKKPKKKAKKEEPEAEKKLVSEWNKSLGMNITTSQDASVTKSEFLSLASGVSVLTMGQYEAASDEIMVRVKKSDAQAAAEFIRANAPEADQALKDFAAALEMVLI